VDFRLSEDQKALQQGIRSFAERRLPLDAVHGSRAGAASIRALEGLAEMGFALRPEREGGLRSGADAVVVRRARPLAAGR
jgi:hypothetical protein